jgi:hypothetical protein
MMLMGATGGVGGGAREFHLFDMLIPPAEWETRGARPESGLMRRHWGTSEVMKMLRGYIRSLERSGLTAFGNDHTIVRPFALLTAQGKADVRIHRSTIR